MAAAGLNPKSPISNERSKKYDRQLRLWGEHGQSALEAAHICLINATALGTETLKSIILPGIGAFTIVDGRKVTGEDVGNNFFLEQNSIGKPLAQAATELLLELNPDVRGDFMDESPEHLLKVNPNFFNNFTFVIATGLHEKTLLNLASRLWKAAIPLLVCRTYGFIGWMRLQLAEHTIIESHPDSVLEDLRLDCPFPTLVEYCNEYDLCQMDAKSHSHTPFVVILLLYLEKWKEMNYGKMPSSYKEKESFKEMIRQGIRKNEDGVPNEEDNFEEAIRAANTVLNPSEVPNCLEEIFNDPACLTITSKSKPFWIMADALKEFVASRGELPVRGTIPDMTSQSEAYIKLQNVYREKANRDASVVYSSVQTTLSTLAKPQDLVMESDVRLFCKHAHCLRVVRTRSIAEEYNPESAKIQAIAMHLDNPDSEMIYYAILRALDRFHSTYNRFPGGFSDQVEPDIVKLKSCLSHVLQDWGCVHQSKDDYIHEMCRYGASELHSVAAFVGGCAAQEVIKVLTAQYVPFDNTFIYNAMTATSATFEL